LPNANNKLLLIILLAVASPVSLLGIERGNIDLLIFFLVALSIISINRFPLISALMVILGMVMKLFPVFSLIIFLETNKKTFTKFGVLIFASTCIYVVFTFSDIVQIRESTPRSIAMSYGADVLWMGLASINENAGAAAKHIFRLVLVVIGFTSLIPLLNKNINRFEYSNDSFIAAFRAGVAIYLGKFLLGNNWDYRLIFLIFTIPQLVTWMDSRQERLVSVTSTIALIAMMFSLWDLVIARELLKMPYGGMVSFFMTEIANLIVFASLAFLLVGSMPNWIKIETKPQHTS
jgi:hypothetical protein